MILRSTVDGLDAVEVDGANFGPKASDVQVDLGRCLNVLACKEVDS